MGIIYMLLASGCFATMSAFIKAIGQSLPLPELVFLRCLLSLPVLFLFVRLRQRPLVVKAKKLLLLRTLFGMTAMSGFFFALTRLQFAECIFLGRTQPLFIALLSPLILGEKTPAASWFAIITGLAGVALILQPDVAWSIGAWVAIAAAGSSALAHMLVRRLNATEYPLVIVFNFTVLTCFFACLWSLPYFVVPTRVQWLFLFCVALFASLGQLCMTLAYQHDRAPAVASASYTSVILAVIYGYFIWGEMPHPLTWVGGGLIVIGGLLLLKSRMHVNEPPSPAAT
ncbi:MAG: permease [Desulfobacterales bacterium SG8_35]|nr:MAG: permease [Desulfobacterales bacterium SG8_35]